MDEESENVKQEEVKPLEVQTLTKDIEDFNKGLDQAVEELAAWKSRLFNLQEKFTEKLKIRTLSMKIK